MNYTGKMFEACGIPQRVTDFRVDEFEITEPDFYRLPDRTQELIRAYAEPVQSGRNGIFRFRIAIYRWDEIKQSMNQLEEGTR